MRRPYFRANRSAWYVWHNGKQVRLGKEKAEAMAAWHRLAAGEGPATSNTKVADVLSLFLDWCQRQRSETTYEWYRLFILSFAKQIGGLKLGNLKPHHVNRWSERFENQNTRNGSIRAVKRAFNWAVDQGLLNDSPVKRVKTPSPRPRDCYLQPEQWSRLISKIEDDEFLDLVTALRETGCRPQEARSVEARHFDRDLRAWCFPVEESKGKKHARTVPPNAGALAITQRLVLKHPDGPIFRNTDGEPWTQGALVCRFRRLRKKLKFEVTAYSIRHTFITDALINGVDPVTLSKIVGHRDLGMIQRVYSKLEMRNDHIQAAVEQATRSVRAG